MNITSILSRNELVFIWEVGLIDRRGALLSIDNDRRVEIKKSWTKVPPGELPKEMTLLHKTPIVIVLHPAFAHSAWNTISIKTNKALSGKEFESALTSSLELANKKHRVTAQNFLGTAEIDTILVDARAFDFSVDGALVPNPVGFEGRSIKGGLRSIFAPRQIFHEFADIIHRGRSLFFTERGSPEMFLLERSRISDEHNLLLLEGESGWLFPDDWPIDTRIKKKNISSPCLKAIEMIAEAWDIDDASAVNVLRKYMLGHCSKRSARAIASITRSVTDDFLSSLNQTKKLSNIYINSDLPVPIELPTKFKKLSINTFPIKEMLSELALYPSENILNHKTNLTYTLAPLAEYYYNEGDPDVHRFLRKRLHWISS